MKKNILKERVRVQRYSYMLALASLMALSISSCKKKDNEEVKPNPTENPQPNPTQDEDGLTTTTIASNLDTPWQLAFASDGRLFFTERPGRVRVIENGQLKQEPYINLRDSIVEAGEAGLTGIVIDPNFATNHYLYLAWTYEKPKASLNFWNKVVRYREDPVTKVPIYDKVLLDSVEGYINHNIGSLHFGPDDKLYITTGDRYIPDYAQDDKKPNGKILRMNRDGSIPDDNPIPGSLIYTKGHRNVQGLAWQPGTNYLFNVEHGPSQTQGCCQDEINLIEKGKNYGWPIIRGGQQQAGLETPVFNSSDSVTWAPCQNIFVTSGAWSGSMLFTGLFDKALHRAIFDPADPKKIVKVETYMKGELGRLRAIAKGPDGRVYISTSNGDGRGIAVNPNDDRILILNINR